MRALLVVVPVLSVACHATPPGTAPADVTTPVGTTSPPAACTETLVPLALSDASPLGFSGQDVADQLGDYLYTPGEWVVLGEAADVMIHLDQVGDDVVFHDLEGTGPDCVDWLEVPATIQFESYLPAGGADIFPVGALAATDLVEIIGTASLAAADVPNLDATEVGVDLSAYDDARVVLETTWTVCEPTTNGGELVGEATQDGAPVSLTIVTW